MAHAPFSKTMTLDDTLYLFHHIFLPPKLPQAKDYNAQHEHLLLDSVVDALRSFTDYVPTADTTILRKATEMIARLRKAHGHRGDVDEKQLMRVLTELPICARNKAIMTTAGRLRRTFPGPTMAMERAAFEEPGLKEFMAQTISRMSHQPVAGTKPKIKKSEQQHDEDRDTTHPKMVTEFLMSSLRPRCTDK
ncbi:hypothetical protein N7522_013560 [Penicillium canescens]|nr:hypothetical protein N7522_013560 [Penicillium canescens]